MPYTLMSHYRFVAFVTLILKIASYKNAHISARRKLFMLIRWNNKTHAHENSKMRVGKNSIE